MPPTRIRRVIVERELKRQGDGKDRKQSRKAGSAGRGAKPNQTRH